MYDLIIIGTGSAGLPAAMYAARYRLKTLAIGNLPGGALGTSHCVENYPAILSAPGGEIMDKMAEHARVSGAELMQDEVGSVEKTVTGFTVKTTSGQSFECKFVLLATGNKYRRLGIPGENEYLGKGVSYCATCDGNFFKNRKVVLVGGGDTAATEALYLAELASEVVVLVRGERMKAENIWQEKLKEHSNVSIRYNTAPAEVVGDVLGMNGVKLMTGEIISADGFFVAIGSDAYADLVKPLGVELDKEGCVVVNSKQESSIKGLYAAGDVTTNSDKFKQTIMSAAEGCLAAHSIHEAMLRG